MGGMNVGQEVATAIAQAFREKLDTQGIVELVSLHGDDLPRPVRFEDVNSFADDVVRALKRELTEDLHNLAAAVLRDLMLPG